MESLNLDKAVKDELTRRAVEDSKSIEGRVTGNAETIGAEVGATLGKGWSLAGMWRRFRKTNVDEFGVGFKKEL